MKLDKAYDYFSAYYEGSLDTSLRAQMERLFESSPRLREDFEAFAGALQDLELGRDSAIEIPADLHDRISARLDKSIYDSERSKPRGLVGFWRKYALGAAAVILLVGGASSVINRNRGSVGESSIISNGSGTSLQEDLQIKGTAKGTFLRFKPAREEIVKIMRLPDAKVLQTYTVSPNQILDVPLQNPAQTPIVLVITSSESKNVLTVSVPGSTKSESTTGEGSLLEMARAMSAHYQRPVLLNSDKGDAMVRWTLNDENLTQSTITPSGVAVEIIDRLIRLRY